ncbi:bacillithiol system redox-active protein YtxJ [Gelidibacter japonicus]|jgi:bacillithiol system protein YtxJ|uniref:bacillithiol system redox-active protein YtxJ n=1 Tax=Gelidibacter japonicus TaxID=1962232 RepID=UPI0013D3D870|nr:bacillithiol system redox-active protein YtxJ [Gelidibacter japonicus]HLU87099.1 bacillithiol system redox-active protein YtxJ [Taishania sp.]
MGLFNKLFGASTSSATNSDQSKQENETPWINLNSMEQLDGIVEKSKTKPQFIFKHSTRCGISRMVISRFKNDYQISGNEADLYYLDLLDYRAISNAIADRFQVMHQSPQLVIIKNGVAVAHESHSGINNIDMEKFIS